MSQEKDPYSFAIRLEDLAARPLVCVTLGGKRIALAHADGVVYAFEDSCPHQGESLSKGKLQGCVVTCPAHNWKFDVKTGDSTVVPDQFVYTFPVEIRGGDVFIKV